MTKPIQWTETETPAPPRPIEHKWRLAAQRWAWLSPTVLESRDATLADLRRALDSMTPEERAEVVGDDLTAVEISALKVAHSDSVAAVQESLAAAIARAETAEKERDEARVLLIHRVEASRLSEANGEISALRSRLAKAEALFQEARPFIIEGVGNEMARGKPMSDIRWRIDALSAPEEVDALSAPEEVDALSAPEEVDALSAPDGEAKRCAEAAPPDAPRWNGFSHASECAGYGDGGFREDRCNCGFKQDEADRNWSKRRRESPPDPNELEELGRIAWDAKCAGPYASEWDDLPRDTQESYRRAAEAVARKVRGT